MNLKVTQDMSKEMKRTNKGYAHLLTLIEHLEAENQLCLLHAIFEIWPLIE